MCKNNHLNISIMTENDKNRIEDIVNIHLKEFKGFFLTSLGKGFLYHLYDGYLMDVSSGIVVASIEDRIVGFIAYSKKYDKFYKFLLKKKIFHFAFYALIAFIKKPSRCMQLLSAFQKSESVQRPEKYIEIASIAVDSSYAKKGIGHEMLEYLKKQTDFQIYGYINLETDADNNDKVNKFYVKNDFELARQYYTKQNRKMNEYRYYGGER